MRYGPRVTKILRFKKTKFRFVGDFASHTPACPFCENNPSRPPDYIYRPLSYYPRSFPPSLFLPFLSLPSFSSPSPRRGGRSRRPPSCTSSSHPPPPPPRRPRPPPSVRSPSPSPRAAATATASAPSLNTRLRQSSSPPLHAASVGAPHRRRLPPLLLQEALGAPRSAAAGPVAGGHGRLPGCDLPQPVHVPALSLDSSAPWFAPPFLFLPLPLNSCTIDMEASSI